MNFHLHLSKETLKDVSAIEKVQRRRCVKYFLSYSWVELFLWVQALHNSIFSKAEEVLIKLFLHISICNKHQSYSTNQLSTEGI